MRPYPALVTRIIPSKTWSHLALHESSLQVIRDIVTHARAYHRMEKGSAQDGRALTALFSGPKGTGKALAAEVVANELEVELHRVALSQVANESIGETEKTLHDVFAAAEGSGAVLFFDEAEALFGKRSDVKDSHDRYANVEASYLLQQMESFNGLTVFATKGEEALDPELLRRFRFVVSFAVPKLG